MTEINLPLVSIALAAYNGQKYIEKQLISLINQDYKNIEIVISDDCSTDGTWDILESYAKKDSRIRLLPRDFNRGYVNNFIRVFGECRGEFISPSDQDDIWYPEKTRRPAGQNGRRKKWRATDSSTHRRSLRLRLRAGAGQKKASGPERKPTNRPR